MSLEGMNATELERHLAVLEAWQEASNQNMDDFFLITMGIIIYLMQAGFAFLEAGSVRSKNTTNILIKNALDSFFSGLAYWLVGYAFAFGKGNGFIGHSYFAHDALPASMFAHWFFQFVFAATAATIVSGAVAERCDFPAYIIYSIILTGFIYPVVTHWAWASEGWLVVGKDYEIDGKNFTVYYQDFAGSGVVHIVGGIAAFVGAWMLGPRIGRFDKTTGEPCEIKGHSVPLASLGGFILVFGFFAFNGSSQGSISSAGDGEAVATAVKNTVLSASGGAFTTLIMNKTKYFGDKKWSYLTTLNGCLAGMVSICAGCYQFASCTALIRSSAVTQVSICAGCNQFESYTALVTGIIGGLTYMLFTWVVIKIKVDDPLDATAVHFGGGIIGVMAVPFFSVDHGILYQRDIQSAYFLAWQLAGLAAIIGWSFACSFTMFFTLKMLKILRVSTDIEMRGLDIPKHGEPAYPIEAYGHGWGEKGDTLMALMERAAKHGTAALTSEDVEINVTIPASKKGTETPELHPHAMERGRNGHVNDAYTTSSEHLSSPSPPKQKHTTHIRVDKL